MQGSMSNMSMDETGVAATQISTNEQIRQNEAAIHALNDRLHAAERLLAKERFLREEAMKRLEDDIEAAVNGAYVQCQQELERQNKLFDVMCEEQGKPLLTEIEAAKQSITGFAEQLKGNHREVEKKIQLNDSKIKYMEERAETIRKGLRTQIEADCKTFVKQQKDLADETAEMLQNAQQYYTQEAEKLNTANEQMITPVLQKIDALTEHLQAERETRQKDFVELGDTIKGCVTTINQKVAGRSRNVSRME